MRFLASPTQSLKMAPSYEMSLIFRALDKTKVVPVFHKLAKQITSSGGVVQSIEDQGAASLPYRMRAHVEWHTTGRQTFMRFLASPETLKSVVQGLKKEQTIIRHSVLRLDDLRAAEPNYFKNCKSQRHEKPLDTTSMLEPFERS
eukprot:m.233023 g.233023  ORF g.233023 m.233023 type:complete len:145 (+) comp18949_c0_seq1:3-437(+)